LTCHNRDFLMKSFTHAILGSAFLAATMASTVATADPEIEAAAKLFAEQSVSQWLGNPLVITAIKAQNEKNASVTQSQIDAMDKAWRAESAGSGGPMITEVTGNSLSKFLREVKDGEQGLVTEIFVMDDKGLNVGQSDVTSDFWQGDEAKWQKTYAASPKAMFVDDVEMDESTQSFQTQISIAITDPDTGKNIGAVTIGVDAEGLLMQ